MYELVLIAAAMGVMLDCGNIAGSVRANIQSPPRSFSTIVGIPWLLYCVAIVLWPSVSSPWSKAGWCAGALAVHSLAGAIIPWFIVPALLGRGSRS